MEANKSQSNLWASQFVNFEMQNNNKPEQAMSQLEAALSRGLAGFREYLNQLPRKEKSKLIQAISKNIESY